MKSSEKEQKRTRKKKGESELDCVAPDGTVSTTGQSGVQQTVRCASDSPVCIGQSGAQSGQLPAPVNSLASASSPSLTAQSLTVLPGGRSKAQRWCEHEFPFVASLSQCDSRHSYKEVLVDGRSSVC
jgi:hypothetical protein